MGRPKFNWGKRFSGPSIEGTRGAHLGELAPSFNMAIAGRVLLRKDRDRTQPISQTRSAAQARSATARRKNGIGKPSMPAFSFEGQEIIPPRVKSRVEVAAMTTKRFPLQEQDRLSASIRDLRRQLLIQEKGRLLLIEALQETRNAIMDGKEEAAEAIIAGALSRAGIEY